MYIKRKRGHEGITHCVGIWRELDLSKVQERSLHCLCLVFDCETNWDQDWELGFLIKFIPCVLNLNQFLSDIISQ